LELVPSAISKAQPEEFKQNGISIGVTSLTALSISFLELVLAMMD
jgi:hypothetical protein